MKILSPAAVRLVLNENALIVVSNPETQWVQVVANKGMTSPKPIGPTILGSTDVVRPAAMGDLDAFRVVAPPEFREATAEQLQGYHALSVCTVNAGREHQVQAADGGPDLPNDEDTPRPKL